MKNKGTKSCLKIVEELNGRGKKSRRGPIMDESGSLELDRKKKAEFPINFSRSWEKSSQVGTRTQIVKTCYLLNDLSQQQQWERLELSQKLQEYLKKLKERKHQDIVKLQLMKNDEFRSVCRSFQSFQQNRFPSMYKVAQLKAAFKKGAKASK